MGLLTVELTGALVSDFEHRVGGIESFKSTCGRETEPVPGLGNPEVTIEPRGMREGFRYTLPRDPSSDPSRDLIVYSRRLGRIVLSERN